MTTTTTTQPRHTTARWLTALEFTAIGIGTGLGALPSGFELTVTDAELDRAIDRLRSAGVGIREITQRRLTLEESFLHLVGKEPV